MNKLYVVFGTTGEYSDRTLWPVKAFNNKEKAQKLVMDATACSNNFFQLCEDGEVDKWGIDFTKVNPYDPDFQMQYTGTSYYIEEVELED